jgi:hypothetical protein
MHCFMVVERRYLYFSAAKQLQNAVYCPYYDMLKRLIKFLFGQRDPSLENPVGLVIVFGTAKGKDV